MVTPGSCGAGGDAGGTDSLVEVRLWLLTLDGGPEGVDGLVSAEHGGVPHCIVGLGTGAQAESPRHQQQPRPQVLHPITQTASTSSSPKPSPHSHKAAEASPSTRMKPLMLKRSHSSKELLGVSEQSIPGSPLGTCPGWVEGRLQVSP